MLDKDLHEVLKDWFEDNSMVPVSDGWETADDLERLIEQEGYTITKKREDVT